MIDITAHYILKLDEIFTLGNALDYGNSDFRDLLKPVKVDPNYVVKVTLCTYNNEYYRYVTPQQLDKLISIISSEEHKSKFIAVHRLPVNSYEPSLVYIKISEIENFEIEILKENE